MIPRVAFALDARGIDRAELVRKSGVERTTLDRTLQAQVDGGGTIDTWERVARALSEIPLKGGDLEKISVAWLRGKDDADSMCAVRVIGEVGGRASMAAEAPFDFSGVEALVCTDDSLAPCIRRGDKVLIDKELPNPGDLVAFLYQGAWIVRIYHPGSSGHLFSALHSANYPIIEMPELPESLHRVRGCLK